MSSRHKSFADLLRENDRLKCEVNRLTQENERLRANIASRMTSEECKKRIRQLKGEGYNSTEIAKKMKREGLPYEPGSIRSVLSRLNKPKKNLEI